MSKPAPMRLLLADDHAIVRAGYRHLLERQDQYVVVAEAGTAAGGTGRLENRLMDSLSLNRLWGKGKWDNFGFELSVGREKNDGF